MVKLLALLILSLSLWSGGASAEATNYRVSVCTGADTSFTATLRSSPGRTAVWERASAGGRVRVEVTPRLDGEAVSIDVEVRGGQPASAHLAISNQAVLAPGETLVLEGGEAADNAVYRGGALPKLAELRPGTYRLLVTRLP